MDVQIMEKAYDMIKQNVLYRKTPMIPLDKTIDLPIYVGLYLKLENMQYTGSFKIRGAINQIANMDKDNFKKKLVTISTGNYGKALATISKELKLDSLIIMPNNASDESVQIIKELRSNVELVDKNLLQKTLDDHVKNDNICGYEIFQQCPDIDIVIASCGGGQFLAGISSAIKHKKPNCKIYGVEPYGGDIGLVKNMWISTALVQYYPFKH
ncbi:uncharacterized protein LOC135925847 [Gordionus sp. m RMFG-2023]|uniref:uncharacterized protein LOC135925847 n=1 Tax=Gordionus sp. m RMFG-2023 TaxID=3053472 RepID=UPI0031FC3E03